jgi:catechol 2,3-dioxygenase-like lactoylglutathione lyase family enzyme
MEITGVDFITVPTRDFERASEFYGTVLGLPFSARWGRMPAAEFETGTLTIAVMQSEAFGLEFQPHTHPIALHVDDVGAAARLQDRFGSGWPAAGARCGARRGGPPPTCPSAGPGAARRTRRGRARAPRASIP